jgi:hypothetical protein
MVAPAPAVLPTNATLLPRLLAYAQALEAGHRPVERPLGRPGLGGAPGWGVAEEDHRPDQLVGPLPGGVDTELQLAPLVGRRDPLAPCRHTRCRLPALPRPHHADAARGHPSGRAILRDGQGHEQYVHRRS